MAKIDSIKYSSDYKSILLTFDTVVSGDLKVSFCLEPGNPFSYTDCKPITISGSDKTIDVATELLNVNYEPLFPNGLVDGIYKFELTVSVETVTQVRLFARDVKNSIYSMVINNIYPLKLYDDVYVDEIFKLFVVYKGLVYNAVAGKEEYVIAILKDLQESCQIMQGRVK